MRKSTAFALGLTILVMFGSPACRPGHERHDQITNDTAVVHLIPADSANKMINSFLGSIHNPQDTALNSLTFLASELKAYLNSDSTIYGMKISFAHTLDYINNGGLNQNCGYRSGALTLIISFYDQSGNFKYSGTRNVMDYATPCPTNCPPGEAGNAIFTISTID